MIRKIFPEVSYSDWRRQVDSQLGKDKTDEILTARADGVDVEALCTAKHPRRALASVVVIPPSVVSEVSISEGKMGWIPCQAFDSSEPEMLNHHLKADLNHGVSGIWLRLDRAARQGEKPLETTSALGVDGTSLYRVEDLGMAFQGTTQDWRLLLLDAGGNYLPAAAMLITWLQNSGHDPRSKTLLFGADPLGALARSGRLSGSLEQMGNDMADLCRFGRENWPGSRALAVSTEPYREAGAEIDQELAICLATGAAYLRLMERHGIEIEATAAEMTFVTGTGSQTFLEVAKLRALRRLWDHLLRTCGLESPAAPWIHSTVLRRSLPSREASLNLVRVSEASLAAALGGADSQSTPPYHRYDDSGLEKRGRRLARNTQLILGLESHVGRVVDPGAGSYFLETVTSDLMAKAWDLLQQIERQGGLQECLTSGWLQKAIAARWEERRTRLERAEIPLTGVNIYADPHTEFSEQDPHPDLQIQERIRQRFTVQNERHDTGHISNPESATTRWDWCLQAAAKNVSIQEMGTALYSSEVDLLAEPLRPRQDSQPFEKEASTS